MHYQNSVYFLVGYSADYSSYPSFSVFAGISNSGSYDIYIDGIKYTTSSHNTETVINWQTLALTSGWDVTYPSNLHTHIVRVTPSASSNTITGLRLNDVKSASELVHGLLWVHFTISNAISLWNGFGSAYKSISPILEAITCSNDKLSISNGLNMLRSSGIKYICPLDATGCSYLSSCVQNCTNLKTLIIDNVSDSTSCDYLCAGCTQLRKVDGRSTIKLMDNTFSGVTNLQSFGNVKFAIATQTSMINTIKNADNIPPTFLDASSNNVLTKLSVSSTGIKGLTVSSEAPFSHATSPQLDVSYSGLDRGALVNLFNSMPTVSAGQVCSIIGCTGTNDLTAADKAIATNKGWTLTLS